MYPKFMITLLVGAVALIGMLAEPAYAKGGGSDRQHDNEKLKIERDKSRDQKAKNSKSLFDLIFGSKTPPKQKTK